MKNWMSEFSVKKHSFLGSLLFGIVLWLFTYAVLPIETAPLTSETIGYLCASYTVFIIGFYAIRLKRNTLVFSIDNCDRFFKIGVVVLVIAITFRYFDLFYYRLMWFNHTYIENKKLSIQNATSAPLIITLIGTLRALYFVPLLYLVVAKSRKKFFWILSVALILFSSIEILLVGTRKPMFYLVLVLFITIGYSYSFKLIMVKKNVFLGAITVILLGLFSYTVLNKRMIENTGSQQGVLKVIESRYNDFVKISPDKIEAFYNNPSANSVKTELLLIHTGQYIVHGVYELDYIIKNNFPSANGVYCFNPVYKFFNRIGITSTNKKQLLKSHPREYVYLTFFGALFVDFGWLALLAIFLFGLFQGVIYQMSDNHILAKLLWMILLTINIAIPIFNLTAGTGVYLLVYMSLLVVLTLKAKRQEK